MQVYFLYKLWYHDVFQFEAYTSLYSNQLPTPLVLLSLLFSLSLIVNVRYCITIFLTYATKHTCTYTHTHVHMYTYTHVHTHIRTYTHTHVHTHVHTHSITRSTYASLRLSPSSSPSPLLPSSPFPSSCQRLSVSFRAPTASSWRALLCRTTSMSCGHSSTSSSLMSSTPQRTLTPGSVRTNWRTRP